ncbi:GNAT family N-acetyltransferase [Vibrio parahaemolyticus]|uniref:GNAT family N-acetyltransferase n=1 Tax=Vibrio parahaemolyticus TaxID=670 RepID=UPI0004162779|nr:GNAT family protein [Vibrio parahaemolyticus]EIV8662912.1 GNAT family N-acetyltransferase [Vibrio parahaemolyticus]ELA9592920.1 GNAT family N-acetyltransferase [Vibrio parahaemolyticus]MBM4933588.1 GNAT family N-acetyltransferase [Vibrio parahaemolyticus]MCI9699232.1 GNAT family N-acetyltransferase [Vibrio parahaemolyticus]MCR9813155.1 GNAT family N-acetyltransferase [Vibrio parahaemolyticus]
MSPDFEIITPRLALRLIPADDAHSLQRLLSQSPSLHTWLDWCDAEVSLKDAQDFLLATRLNWVKTEAFGFGIYDRDSNTLLGMAAVNELYHTFNMASIGYWVADCYQRQGYAQEAIKALAEFCFAKLSLTRIEIVCDPDNNASQALIESVGAKKEAIARNRFIFHGKPKDGVVYSLLPTDLL